MLRLGAFESCRLATGSTRSYWPNGSRAFGFEESVYNVGAGQWHHLLNFSDPIFGSSRAMVSGHSDFGGEVDLN